MREGLNHRQQLFVAEYLIDLNATRAATAAGYSKSRAAVAGAELVRNRKVAAEIVKKQDKRLGKLEITAERVLRELALMGFANMLDYMTVGADGMADVDLSKLTREQAAAIQEITVDTTGGSGDGERRLVLRNKFKLGDKRGSLELLGKHLELFTEKVKLVGDAELVERLTAGRRRAAEGR
jgi:phage terminase small subunit